MVFTLNFFGSRQSFFRSLASRKPLLFSLPSGELRRKELDWRRSAEPVTRPWRGMGRIERKEVGRDPLLRELGDPLPRGTLAVYGLLLQPPRSVSRHHRSVPTPGAHRRRILSVRGPRAT